MKDLLIVTPYRNREEHLKGFLENSPFYFNNQNLTYDMLICELDQGGDWNAGLCVNSLIKFINNERQYKYLYIHHVDIWPENGNWIFPEENQAYYNLGDYGSCLMKLDTFLEIKGYSNSFWGWGGEDNEIYAKLQAYGHFCINSETSFPVIYNTDFQNHERKFNGSNYGNGIKNLLILSNEEKNDITNFDEHAIVKDFEQLGPNLYKQIVCPLKKSPRDTINNKVILGYLQNETDFENVVPFVKSAMMYAAYSFDVVIFIADQNPEPKLLDQLEAFGIKYILHTPFIPDLFVDRHWAFRQFLVNNEQYDIILHVDVSDTFFQDDPFKHFDNNKLTITSEGIKIKDERWNVSSLLAIYGSHILNEIGDCDVVCGGIIGGPKHLYIQLAEKIEYEFAVVPHIARGTDQPYLQKIIYKDKFLENKLNIKTLEEDFCINLHVCDAYSKDYDTRYYIENNKVVYNSLDKRFSIVHQYNRFPDLYSSIRKHFIEFFGPL